SVCALDGTPGIVLRHTILLLFRGMPADRSGIKKDVRPLQRRKTRALWIPLVPADQCAHTSELSIESLEPEVSGGEIVLLVIERIVRYVHFAVDAFDGSIRVDDGSCVVIEAARAFFKEGSDDNYFVLPRNFAEFVGGRTGNGLSKVEQSSVLALTEILGTEEFR